jgi:hypothetical protein
MLNNFMKDVAAKKTTVEDATAGSKDASPKFLSGIRPTSPSSSSARADTTIAVVNFVLVSAIVFSCCYAYGSSSRTPN